jgi:hypothetical protein
LPGVAWTAPSDVQDGENFLSFAFFADPAQLAQVFERSASANWSVATSGSLFWASIGLIDSLLKTFSGWRRFCRNLEPVPSLTL